MRRSGEAVTAEEESRNWLTKEDTENLGCQNPEVN